MKITSADRWFSLFVRLRDTWEDGYCRCITCGRVGEPKSFDCGHYVKRQHTSVRFDERNGNAQCKYCNAFEQGRDHVYRQKLVEMYGEETVLLLESAKRHNGKLSAFTIQHYTELYKAKAKEIAAMKNIKIW